jgi:dynactin complex subunit
MKIKPSIAINDNGFLFDPNSGESYTTNPVAKEIIFMMKQNLSNDEIQSRIVERYDVDEITLEKNLIDFMAMLRYYNLCEESGK